MVEMVGVLGSHDGRWCNMDEGCYPAGIALNMSCGDQDHTQEVVVVQNGNTCDRPCIKTTSQEAQYQYQTAIAQSLTLRITIQGAVI